MIPTEPILHIGGCADGERRKVTSRRMRLFDRVGGLVLSESGNNIVDGSRIEDVIYELKKIRGEHREFEVMVLEGMSPDEMIESLISNYPAPK